MQGFAVSIFYSVLFLIVFSTPASAVTPKSSVAMTRAGCMGCHEGEQMEITQPTKTKAKANQKQQTSVT